MTDRPTNRFVNSRSGPRDNPAADTERVNAQYGDRDTPTSWIQDDGSNVPTQASSLAWSEDDGAAGPEPAGYYDAPQLGGYYDAPYPAPVGSAGQPSYPYNDPAQHTPWFRSAPTLLALGATVAVLAAGGGLAYTMTSSSEKAPAPKPASVAPASPRRSVHPAAGLAPQLVGARRRRRRVRGLCGADRSVGRRDVRRLHQARRHRDLDGIHRLDNRPRPVSARACALQLRGHPRFRGSARGVRLGWRRLAGAGVRDRTADRGPYRRLAESSARDRGGRGADTRGRVARDRARSRRSDRRGDLCAQRLPHARKPTGQLDRAAESAAGGRHLDCSRFPRRTEPRRRRLSPDRRRAGGCGLRLLARVEAAQVVLARGDRASAAAASWFQTCWRTHRSRWLRATSSASWPTSRTRSVARARR